MPFNRSWAISRHQDMQFYFSPNVIINHRACITCIGIGFSSILSLYAFEFHSICISSFQFSLWNIPQHECVSAEPSYLNTDFLDALANPLDRNQLFWMSLKSTNVILSTVLAQNGVVDSLLVVERQRRCVDILSMPCITRRHKQI